MASNTQPFRSDVIDYETFARYLEPPRPCPLCGSTAGSVWGSRGSFRAVQCEQCTHVYMERVLSAEGLQKFYDGYIAFRLGAAAAEKLSLRAAMYAVDCKYLLSHVSSGRLLDVGCSAGEFLQHLLEHFDAYGIERDPTAVELAHRRDGRLRDRVVMGEPHNLSPDFKPVDVLVMRGVIEHLPDPVATMRHLAKTVKPGGKLFITATPNVDCPCAEVFREKWNQFDPIQHVSHFSARTLSSLVGHFGFVLEAEYYPYLDTPYARPSEDLRIVRAAVMLDEAGRRSEMPRSPAFWGTMMTLVFRRNVTLDT